MAVLSGNLGRITSISSIPCGTEMYIYYKYNFNLCREARRPFWHSWRFQNIVDVHAVNLPHTIGEHGKVPLANVASGTQGSRIGPETYVLLCAKVLYGLWVWTDTTKHKYGYCESNIALCRHFLEGAKDGLQIRDPIRHLRPPHRTNKCCLCLEFIYSEYEFQRYV